MPPCHLQLLSLAQQLLAGSRWHHHSTHEPAPSIVLGWWVAVVGAAMQLTGREEHLGSKGLPHWLVGLCTCTKQLAHQGCAGVVVATTGGAAAVRGGGGAEALTPLGWSAPVPQMSLLAGAEALTPLGWSAPVPQVSLLAGGRPLRGLAGQHNAPAPPGCELALGGHS